MFKIIDSSFSIKQKFIYLYLLIFFIPMVVVCFIAYNNVYANNLEKFEKGNLETFEKINQQLDEYFNDIEIIGNDIFYNQKITDIITKPAEYKYSEKEDLETFNWLTSALVTSRSGINLDFYVQDEKIYARTKEVVYPISELDNRQNINIVEYMGEQVFKWLPYNQNDEIFLYAVNINRGIGENNGYAIIYTKVENIKKIIDDYNNYDDTSYFLLARDENIILNFNEESDIDISFDLSEFHDIDAANQIISKKIKYKDTDYQITYQNIDGIDSYLVSLTESSIINKAITRNLFFVIGMIIVSLIICITLAYILSSKITNNLEVLTKRMELAHEELFGERKLSTTKVKDESLQLQNEFQSMIARMRELIDRNYNQKIENQQVQMNMMQMQINPHFLYNILDSINWIAIKKELPTISELVTNLAKYYRLGLSGGNTMVTLSTELEHIDVFIKLQNTRFAHNIKVDYIIESEVEHLKTVKCILQPIVENAILHGIVKNNRALGNIVINIYTDDDTLVIEVWDKGGDIDIEAFNYMKNNKPVNDNKGFAIYNVHNRLILAYSTEKNYGLSAIIDQSWTKVILRQPIIKN